MAAQSPIRETIPRPAGGPAGADGTRAGRLDFITAIPQDVYRGSGCFVGIQTLAKGLAQLNCDVAMITPEFHLPVLMLERFIFNERLRWRTFRPGAITVGFDADAYSIAGHKGRPHVASIKGVIGDVLPFERGAAKASVILQAHFEKLHARRADLVITPSRYCAERLDELYGVRNAIVIPELIDLERWHDLLRAGRSTSGRGTFHCPLCLPVLCSKACGSSAACRGDAPGEEFLSSRFESWAEGWRKPVFGAYGVNCISNQS